MADRVGYNERLFSGQGLRQKYHIWRFLWLKKQAEKYLPRDIRAVEIGCFDARSLQYLPGKVERYVGIDADWEGGISSAQSKFSGRPDLRFLKSSSPVDLEKFDDNEFNVAISLETLEHIDPDLIESYLINISRILDGYFFISVPNEKGLVFVIKYMIKYLLSANSKEKYTLSEFANAALGRMSRIDRREHKGFDHDALRRQIQQHFDIVSVSGGPIAFLPAALNLTVAIVARTRKKG